MIQGRDLKVKAFVTHRFINSIYAAMVASAATGAAETNEESRHSAAGKYPDVQLGVGFPHGSRGTRRGGPGRAARSSSTFQKVAAQRGHTLPLIHGQIRIGRIIRIPGAI